jgi:hypothetical protein
MNMKKHWPNLKSKTGGQYLFVMNSGKLINDKDLIIFADEARVVYL